MPLPFLIGSGRTLMWRHPKPATGDGLVAVFRDKFDGSIDAAWTNTGAVTTYDNEASLIGTGTWGGERLKHTAGLTRQDGRALVALVLPEDFADQFAVGWATGVVADARTDGHSWLTDAGYFQLATPGREVILSGTGGTQWSAQRGVEYYVAVVLRGQGAFYLISTVAAYSKINSSQDQIGIPQYPDARVLWVDDAATTTPMYPLLSAATTHSYPNGNLVDDLRVIDVPSWATDQGLATFLDRATRADSTTAIGNSWASDAGTWGISSNKIYLQSVSGFSRAWHDSGLTGDGIWRCKITWPTTVTNGVGMIIRRIDSGNFIRVWNDSLNSTIRVQTWVAGAFGAAIGQTSGQPVFVAGQTYELTVITKGPWYQVYIDGVLRMDWAQDVNNRHLTGSGIGTYASVNTDARWDDFLAVPNTIALPTELRQGRTPHIWTPGAILMQDTFTAADGTAIAGRTPSTPVGANTWQVSGAGFQITGNALVNTNINGADVADYAYYDVGATDVEVIANVTTPAAMDTLRDGIAVRFSSATTNIHCRIFKDPLQNGSDEVELWAVYSGSGANDLHKQNIGSYWQVNTTYELKLQIVGRLAMVFVDGNPIVAYHVPIAYTATAVGWYHNRLDDGCNLLDFTVRALS